MSGSAAGADRLRNVIAACTFIWVGVYFPLETYVTWDLDGARAWLWASYVMNVVGMGLMFWSGLAARRRQPEAPALLAVGWAWTAATFWRATANRFWWVAEGRELYVGPIELWLAIGFTTVAVAFTAASIVLVFKSTSQARLPA